MLSRTIELHNGVHLPRVGLGTFKAGGQELSGAVVAALNVGIRHIDTALIYKNQPVIAAAMAQQPVARKEVFITSKISPYQQGTEKAKAACEEILSQLGTDSVDLVLIHWPGASKVDVASPRNAELRLETWRVLESYYRAGVFRSIGVSNYEVPHLAELLERAEVKPMVNQVELHPRRQCKQLRELCAAHGVAIVAYASLGCGDLLTHPVVQRVAKEVGKEPAQVLLRWALQHGCAVIPKSVRPERIAGFSEAALLGADWGLSESQMRALDGLEDGHKYCWNPEGIR